MALSVAEKVALRMATEGPAAMDAFLDCFSDEEILGLLQSWEAWWGRPEQQEPEGDWKEWLLLTGRGWGKTRTLSEWMYKRAVRGSRKAFMLGRTYEAVRDVMISGESGLLLVAEQHGTPWEFKSSTGHVVTHTGSTIKMHTSEKPDALRGPNYDCLVAGSQIDMADGTTKAVEDIEVGDLVATRFGPKPVTATVQKERTCRTILLDDGRRITGADGHRIWLDCQARWAALSDILAGCRYEFASGVGPSSKPGPVGSIARTTSAGEKRGRLGTEKPTPRPCAKVDPDTRATRTLLGLEPSGAESIKTVGTGSSTSSGSGPSPMTTTSTTSTGTTGTTTRPTCSCSLVPNTPPCTGATTAPQPWPDGEEIQAAGSPIPATSAERTTSASHSAPRRQRVLGSVGESVVVQPQFGRSDLLSDAPTVAVSSSPSGETSSRAVVRVLSVRDAGVQQVYDFTVAGVHEYSAHGFVHHNTGLVDEFAALKAMVGVDGLTAFDNARFTLRSIVPGLIPRMAMATTPKRVKAVKDMLLDAANPEKKIHVTVGSMMDNKSNLADTFTSTIISKYGGTALAQQEIDGVLASDVEGAQFSSLWFNATRILNEADLPALDRPVITVDPSFAEEDGDTCGIAVGALSAGTIRTEIKHGALSVMKDVRHVYILEDASIDGSPDQWADKVVEMAHKWGVFEIVVEQRQGYAVAKPLIAARDKSLKVRQVNAIQGKAVRAEPVAGLFAQGRAHMVGEWPDMEDECTTFVPGRGMRSPGRMDAMCYVPLWLMKDLNKGEVKYASASAFSRQINTHGR